MASPAAMAWSTSAARCPIGTGTPWAATTRLPACSRRSTAPHTRRVAQPDLPGPPDPAEAAAARRRMVLVTAVGAVLAGALLFALVARAMSTGTSSGAGGTDAEGKPRVAQFDVGRAADRAATIARNGPILFPDPQGGSVDIYVQHLGEKNWVAF